MGQVLGYTALLLRAYARDRTALFFGFLFPLLFMVLFGVLNFGGSVRVDLAVVDEAGNEQSASFIATLRNIETLRVTTGAVCVTANDSSFTTEFRIALPTAPASGCALLS